MSIAVFTSFGQQLDNNGDPLNGGSVTVYQDGTTNLIQLYNDEDLAGGHETSNPITLDSAGRHAITYFTAESYKVVVKDSGGSTIYTRDNIDTGVPLGTGILAIANGGTAASSAATALSNLGGATAAELADVAADVAALSGSLASTEKTHIATGTTAQRTASPVEGDIRRNTTDHVWEGYNNSAVWENFVTMATGQTTVIATQAQQESGSSLVVFPTSGTQHFHQSAAKCWLICGVTANILASYNITSLTDTGTGDVAVTIATDFSSANYALVCAAQAGGTSQTLENVKNSTIAAGTFSLTSFNSSTAAAVDPLTHQAAAWGDFA